MPQSPRGSLTLHEILSSCGTAKGNLLEAISRCGDEFYSNAAKRLFGGGHVLRKATDAESCWIGARLIWLSPGTKFTTRISIVSSRLDRKLDQHDEWFDALRTAVLRQSARQACFLISSGSTASPYVSRCTELFGRLSVEIVMPSGNDIEAWIRDRIFSVEPTGPTVTLSPPLAGEDGDAVAREIASVPLHDRAMFALSDRIVALRVRRGGHMVMLLQHALQSKVFEPGTIRIHIGSRPEPTANDLLSLGAAGWHIVESKTENASGTAVHAAAYQDRPSIGTIDSIPMKRYLTHWTRRQPGPWPNQAQQEFIDELLLALPSKDRSALASLARITAQQQLLASNRISRSGPPAVSFTSVPLQDWGDRRTFRVHRSRWDFEPYGICIDRDWLERSGTRAVVYGDESTWASLDAEHRPFFQPAKTITKSGDEIDWTEEQEHRHLGNVDLAAIADDAACVFVPTIEEAEHLMQISRWPVIVVGHKKRSA
ncbi:MAG: hypothetical protein KDB27_26955 [Planctomycetales bacterium]|nr:hypothetical protein [Planctomycetales bacterium]